jgi:hypothetical protein
LGFAVAWYFYITNPLVPFGLWWPWGDGMTTSFRVGLRPGAGPGAKRLRFAAAGFIALDWVRAQPHNRFDEPPPWQFGQEKLEGAGHCAAPLK